MQVSTASIIFCELIPHSFHFAETSLKYWRIIALNMCEFHDNWWNEIYNFPTAVNETPWKVVP